MKRILITYANQRFQYNQQANADSAREVGSFDAIRMHRPSSLDIAFRWRNRHILRGTTGGGYWLWKPYIIHKALQDTSDGDLVFYCDAGAIFIRPVDILYDLLMSLHQPILCFDLPYLEKAYTKRDAFVLLDCDEPTFADTRQRLAGYIIIKNCHESRSFIREWLSAAQDDRLITDRKNSQGRDNYNDFVAHRHDQSIFSLLSKIYGFDSFRDPSQFGEHLRAAHPESQYEQLLSLTRFVREPRYYFKPYNWYGTVRRAAARPELIAQRARKVVAARTTRARP